MKRFFHFGILMIMFLTIFSSKVLATNYEINNFHSTIELEQNGTLRIKEEIEVNFLIDQHGIYRKIPYKYDKKDGILVTRLKILGVKDENGNRIKYSVSTINQSKQIKIGDADKTVKGIKKYTIEYINEGVVMDYGEGPEIYWNVSGNDWSGLIKKTTAIVKSPFGKIIKTECFDCKSEFDEKEAKFEGEKGLTIVVQIDKNNNLKKPLISLEIRNLVIKILAYLVSIMPLIVMFIFWFNKGRDKKYLTDNIYYKPEDGDEKNVPLLSRPHLPLVYSPIDGLSPAEVGTIIDERVDTKDIVAEIVELARLGYLTIKKIETKKFLGLGNDDYQLTRSKKTTEKLNKFQENLLNNLFNNKLEIKISELKNHFYKNLSGLKKDLYEVLVDKKMAEKNFGTVKITWIFLSILINGIAFVLVSILIDQTNDFWPILLLFLGLIFSLILAVNMPRKTAWGYSLHRQAVGLKYYLSKGKWREEIAEKNLFLEEMLPLAISLGIVGQLAKDMKDLGVEPPRYFEGMVIGSFARDLNNFNSVAVSGLTTSPNSGGSGWSGGSGFSGGGGGGFGGGGGGSW